MTAGDRSLSARGQDQDYGQPAPGALAAPRTTAELNAESSRQQAYLTTDASRLPRRFVARPGPRGQLRVVMESEPVGAEPDLSAAATFGLSVDGPNFGELGTLPPDPTLGAGPSQVIVAANGKIQSYNKGTGAPDNVLDVTTPVFFQTVRAGAAVLSPRVRYDRLAGRWFVTMVTAASPGRVLIASSNASTITAATVWSFFAVDNNFSGTACVLDSPTLGIDNAALYVGVVQFCDGGATYAGTSGFVIRKTSVINAATPVVTAFHNLTGSPTGSGPFAPVGVDNDDPLSAAGYFIGVDNASLGQLVVRRVTNPGVSPAITGNLTIAVLGTAQPITVRHAGNSGSAAGHLDGGDDRLTSASARGGRIWATHTIGVNEGGQATGTITRNGVRWYEIAAITGTPVIAQAGTLFAAGAAGSVNERNYWMPSVAASTRGRVAIGYSTAGASDFVNAGVSERLTGDAAGTLRAPHIFTASTTSYNPPGDPGTVAAGRRWGSRSETTMDGCDGSSIWTIQQYVDTTDSYGLRIGRTVGPAPATPVGVSPSAVATGVASVNLQVTASASGGSGFFDPGVGYLCRLGAAIPGVTVNSVTMTSATSATVNVSTVNAVPGMKAVTIVNPDGQSASSGAILQVTPGVAMAIDTPSGAAAGQPLSVQGWAIDGATPSGTGVDAVHIYAYPAGGAPVFLGAAAYGASRLDIGAAYGSRFAASGFALQATSVLPSGPYTIVVYAHSTATGTFNNTAAVNVTLTAPAAPFGVIDTPADNVTSSGELAVTGWALDDAGIAAVDVLRAPVAGEAGLVYIGRATFVRGARPDVQAAYPGLPNADSAGWGLMILTNMLPNQGNGVFDIHVIATDVGGLQTHLGTRRITAANAASPMPFGTIDTPGQGATVSGTVVNFGWALTPREATGAAPKLIPTDGSTIDVYIDGVFRGHPVYNNRREDIVGLFPGLRNSEGAVGYFVIDTTQLSNGLHTISWVVRDTAGFGAGIGSRFFRVQNGS